MKHLIIKGAVLVYIPKITGRELAKLDPAFFMSFREIGEKTWYYKEAFFSEEESRPGWYVISEQLIQRTRSKPFADAEAVLKEFEGSALNFAELAYFLWLYKDQFKETLLKMDMSWTSSTRTSTGERVVIGMMVNGDVRVSTNKSSVMFSSQGLLFSRKI